VRGQDEHFEVTTNENHIDLLAAELKMMIMNFLAYNDLCVASRVSKSWLAIANEVRPKKLEILINRLKTSALWGYLPAIANNEDVAEFIKEHIYQSISVRNNLSLAKVLDNIFKLHAIKDASHPYVAKISASSLQNDAQSIVLQCANYQITTTDTILQWPREKTSELISMFEKFLGLEEKFAVIRMWYHYHRCKSKDERVEVLNDPTINANLGSEGLQFLNANLQLGSEFIKQVGMRSNIGLLFHPQRSKPENDNPVEQINLLSSLS